MTIKHGITPTHTQTLHRQLSCRWLPACQIRLGLTLLYLGTLGTYLGTVESCYLQPDQKAQIGAGPECCVEGKWRRKLAGSGDGRLIRSAPGTTHISLLICIYFLIVVNEPGLIVAETDSRSRGLEVAQQYVCSYAHSCTLCSPCSFPCWHACRVHIRPTRSCLLPFGSNA